jgi:hypothetical protein
MKSYTTKPNDSFANIAEEYKIKDENYLKTFHNLHCLMGETIQDEIPAGTKILIPEDPQYLVEDTRSDSDMITANEVYAQNDYDDHEKHLSEDEDSEDEKEVFKETNDKDEQNVDNSIIEEESSSSDHDGKYFVIQKGMCQCNQGFKFPKFKVTSHQKHYWNDADGQADYLAVTEDDLTLDPIAMPFGNCKLKPSSSGYLPCSYAPAGKWMKTYDKVKVMGKCCVTEISELMCSTGGKITIFKHGQQSEIGKSNLDKADSQEQHMYNPLVDFEEFKEEINGDDPFEVE